MPGFQLVESWDWTGAGDVFQNQHQMSRATWHCGDPAIEGQRTITRQAAQERLSFLARLAANGYPALVGLSFPFSFPFYEKKNKFVDGSGTWLDFSNSIMGALDQQQGQAMAFYGEPSMYGKGTVADHFAHLSKGIENVGPRFSEAYRATERNIISLGITVQSVFRLAPPMVGVQAITGIYLLRCLLRYCAQKQMPLTIWPLGYLNRQAKWLAGQTNWDDPGLVLVETSPRLSYHRAGTQFLRFNDREELVQAVQNLGTAIPAGAIGLPSRHDREAPSHDAIVTLLHLLSPGWFRSQVTPGLNGCHIKDGVYDDFLDFSSGVPAGTPENLLCLEGNVFGA